ncbi:MAG: uncharacterized protein JWN34_4012 [Bryobacterales bacterium]|nr:uncharacterized protein [Bryobacterales bacterium]
MSSRLRSRLVWHQVQAPEAVSPPGLLRALAPPGTPPGTPAPIVSKEKPDFEVPVAPRERAIALLHVGSEIEHALMVQYLYAGYSLSEDQPDEHRRALVKKWKAVILEIAREEMGHLATVQNMLTLIGGPLCFEREDYPIIDPNLWPFPFQLEHLTKDSLAKYVLAEMPSKEVLAKLNLTEEIEEIERRLKTNDDLLVHRVGAVYEEIMLLFTEGPMIQGPIIHHVTDPHPFVPTVDIQADSLQFQVNPGAWGLGYKQILIEVAWDRTSALDAIQKVSVQGEGPISSGPDMVQEYEGSHFRRFLDVYREFPEEEEWKPARHVATNPVTNPENNDPNRRIKGEASCWADLANLRYRMLLLYLKHSFYIESPAGNSTPSARGALVSWAFGEMYNLRTLSEVLMNLPLQPGSEWMAGPPFEMPYTIALPTRSTNRWRAHRDLLMASIELVGKMLTTGQIQEKYLRALRAADETALEQVNALIGA